MGLQGMVAYFYDSSGWVSLMGMVYKTGKDCLELIKIVMSFF